jgi:hypothetical protein
MADRRTSGRLYEVTGEGAEYPKAERSGRKGLVPWAAVIPPFALVVVVAALFLAALATGGLSSGPARAAIVDQLSLTSPNPGFVERATDTLEKAGYAVDYYSGKEVTVDLYRNLQTKGYRLIVFRTHSSRLEGEWMGDYYDHAVLWTSELYDPSRYIEEQRELRLGPVYRYEGGRRWFGIDPGFVVSSMRGNFNGTTIIMMGCDGLTTNKTAEAFLWRGAKAVVSWDDAVSADHTDAVTDRLLELLTVEGLGTPEAVDQATTELGPDPWYGAELRYLLR